MKHTNSKPNKLTLREMAIFGMLGGLMYATTFAMKALPNIHLLGMFIVAITAVYRAKALLPIYVYVFLEGIGQGFSLWWLPYLYIWTLLWGATMLIPKKTPKKILPFVYAAVSGAHGFLFGTLYAPAQALLCHFTFKQTLMWISAGIPFDIIHGISNIAFGIAIMPVINVLKLTENHNKK